MVDLLDFRSFLNGEATASEPNDIEAGEEIDLVDNAIRWDVAGHPGVALHHREIADGDELVDRSASAQKDAVAQFTMTRDHHVVRDDVVVPNLDVVSQVGDGHEEIAISDDGVTAFLGAPVDRDMLPKSVSFANEDACFRGGVKTEILGISSDHGTVAD